MDFQIWYLMWFYVFPIWVPVSLSIWAAIMCLHWSQIAAKPLYAALVTTASDRLGFLNWDLKIYWFWQFCMQFSVLINFFCGFAVLDDFFSMVLQFLIDPNIPLWKWSILLSKDWAYYRYTPPDAVSISLIALFFNLFSFLIESFTNYKPIQHVPEFSLLE